MDFKEIFNRYEKGDISEEERKFIEEEIEKNKIINEYILRDFSEEFNILNEESYLNKEEINVANKKEVKNIKKKIRVSIMKIIITSIIATILFTNFGSKILNSLYYNPSEKISSPKFQDFTRFDLDISVFTELHLPNYSTTLTFINNTGIGKYNIEVVNKNRFRNENKFISINLNKGKVDKNNYFAFDFPSYNVFDYDWKEINEEEFKKGSIASAYLTFNEELTLEEVDKKFRNNGINIDYVAVNIDSENNIIGFRPAFSQRTRSLEDYESVKEEIYIKLKEKKYSDNDKYLIEEDYFKELIKYMANRNEFLESLFDFNYINTHMYNYVLEQIETYGVNIKGIYVTGTTEELLKTFKDENIKGILIDESRFSIYQN